MDNKFEALEVQALMLSAGERAAMAQRLLASLDDDSQVDDAWAVEVELRIAEIENGALPLIPMKQALADVRAALK
jgi:putative addiction module component (TIGR02574 family)